MNNTDLQTFTFKLTDDNSVGFFWKAKLLENFDSKYQNIKVIQHPIFGKALLLDDYVMFCEYDEHKYHELISYPALSCLEKCSEVLVVGGGDTLTVKRLLSTNVEKVTMVEIDEDVFKICKNHFPNLLNDYLKDSRLNIIFDNAIKIIEEQKKYDLILLDIQDCRDQDMASHVLFTEHFYLNCQKKLSKNGVMVAQISCPYLLSEHFDSQSKILKKLFKNTFIYGAYMHCYGMHQYFIACSDTVSFNPVKIKEDINLKFDWDFTIFNN